MRTKAEWETLFRKIGVEDAEGWAASEFEERLGNLTSLAFLRELRKLVPASDDQFWLKRWVAYEADTQLEASAAYSRLLNAGANNDDLLLLLRGVMSEFLQQTVSALDSGQPSDLEDEIAEQIQWRFVKLMRTITWCHSRECMSWPMETHRDANSTFDPNALAARGSI